MKQRNTLSRTRVHSHRPNIIAHQTPEKKTKITTHQLPNKPNEREPQVKISERPRSILPWFTTLCDVTNHQNSREEISLNFSNFPYLPPSIALKCRRQTTRDKLQRVDFPNKNERREPHERHSPFASLQFEESFQHHPQSESSPVMWVAKFVATILVDTVDLAGSTFLFLAMG